MSNAPTVERFHPNGGLSGSATVDQVREALGGLAGNTDMALLKRVFAWMRAEGWYASSSAFRVSKGRRIGIDYETGWRNAVGVCRRDADSRFFGPTQWHAVSSVREAVDLLVLLGVLPVEFSSMYAAGRADRAVDGAR